MPATILIVLLSSASAAPARGTERPASMALDRVAAAANAGPIPADLPGAAGAGRALSGSQPVASSGQAPLTLAAALAQARANSQQMRAALIGSGIATEDRVQARAALLPSFNGSSQIIYTEPNGTASGVFVANNGPREYITWGQVHGDLFAPGKWADYRRVQAAEAVAHAKVDVAVRGLVAAVVQAYYGALAAQRKAANARQSVDEAQQFLEISQHLEQGGEVAHSDVVKARIQLAQRQREAQDAELGVEKTRLALAILVFPDFRDDFTLADDLQEVSPLPAQDEVQAAATETSPELRAARAELDEQTFGVSVARGGLLPSASFDYWYGLDANQFATAFYDPLGIRHHNVGSAVQAQLTIPLWSWGATQSKLRQADLRVQQAKADLALAERQLLANVRMFFHEARTARDQVASLRDTLDLAAESLRLTLLRYRAGEVTVLEVVDAQATLIQSRNAYEDGLVRYHVALAALQTLTGTL